MFLILGYIPRNVSVRQHAHSQFAKTFDEFVKPRWPDAVVPAPFASSDSVIRVNDSTRVTIFDDSDSTRVTLRRMVTRLESSRVFHRMTRLDSQSMTRVRVIFTKSMSSCSWWTTQFVCTQRNKHFLLQRWSRLAEIFSLACLVVLRCILRINFPQLAQMKTWDFAFSKGSAGHNILSPYRGLM